VIQVIDLIGERKKNWENLKYKKKDINEFKGENISNWENMIKQDFLKIKKKDLV